MSATPGLRTVFRVMLPKSWRDAKGRFAYNTEGIKAFANAATMGLMAEASATLITKALKETAPVNTQPDPDGPPAGRLRDSLTAQVLRGGGLMAPAAGSTDAAIDLGTPTIAVLFSAGVAYAQMVDQGVAPHAISASGGLFLRWPGRDAPDTTNFGWWNPDVRFAESVDHPGQPGQGYVAAAMKRAEPEIRALLRYYATRSALTGANAGEMVWPLFVQKGVT